MKSVTILSLFFTLSIGRNSYATVSAQCAANMSAFPPDPETECCGVEAATKHQSVESVEIDQYPWLAIIEYAKKDTNKVICGGALVSGKYILTTGYCVAGRQAARLKPTNVILGEYDITHEGPDCMPVATGGEDCSEGAIRIPIEKIIPHPLFSLNDFLQNDIALVRMTAMAPYTDFIRPICLPTSDITLQSDRKYLTLAGWGTVNGPSAVKKQVDLPLVSRETCQMLHSDLARNLSLSEGQFCAGGEKGKDSCQGDGGMPLVYENGHRYEAIGLVSFGTNPCGKDNRPSVYTNVFEYKSWIISNMAP